MALIIVKLFQRCLYPLSMDMPSRSCSLSRLVLLSYSTLPHISFQVREGQVCRIACQRLEQAYVALILVSHVFLLGYTVSWMAGFSVCW